MVLITPVIQKYGVYACVKQIFRLRLLIALVGADGVFVVEIDFVFVVIFLITNLETMIDIPAE